MYQLHCPLKTNAYDIANTFNNYFAPIAETTKRSIKYSHKHFSDYLSNESSSTIFLQPTDKEEIANIISSLNSSKDLVWIYSLDLDNNILHLMP